MAQCTQCGHDLATGRYCMNCGHPVGPDDAGVGHDGRTDTAERPAVRATIKDPPRPVVRTAPAAFEPPPAPRFPLYADERTGERTGERTEQADVAPVVSTSPAPTEAVDPARRRRGVAPWVAVGLGLVLVAGLGLALLTLGDDDPTSARDDGSRSPASSNAPDDASPTAPPSPTPEVTSEPPTETEPPTMPADVARFARANVPATAAPGRDVQGNAVRYGAFNLLDGVPTSAWRMPGSGEGDEIVFTLDKRTRITVVGLINGYTKTDPGYDGYTANRRISKVTWTFDDGSSATQRLDDVRRMQTISVPSTKTRTVRLRLDSVTRPGKGKQGRDYTAISDVTLVGKPVGR